MPKMTSMLASWAMALAQVCSATPSFHDDVGVLRYVNPKVGTYGTTPNGNGGMIPSAAPPFGMTRWTPQTRENFISQCPYNDMDTYIHGFQATHQPAIWMGESGQVVLTPGVGIVQPLFTDRGHAFKKEDEVSTPYVYQVTMDAAHTVTGQNLTESIYSPVPGGEQPVPEVVRQGANGRTRRAVPLNTSPLPAGHGEPQRLGLLSTSDTRTYENDSIETTMTATSHVGYLRFNFPALDESPSASCEEPGPFVFVQATRQNWTGNIEVDAAAREVSGSNSQRQDYALGPFRAPNFRGYFVSRFSQPFSAHGIAYGNDIEHGATSGSGTHLGAYVRFQPRTKQVEVRTGVSFVSVDQARKNLDLEVPDGVSLEETVEQLKQAWLEKLSRVEIIGVNDTDADHDQRTIWYTGLFHALQYPSDFSEPVERPAGGMRTFYEGYTDIVRHSNDSYYQSWSIWDTFRAEHSLLTMFAPERVNPMMRSLLTIYGLAGRLPMWANVIETNIMLATHVDAVLANALTRGFRSFDIAKAWEAVKMNAFEPPANDTELLYYDREGYTPQEVRAGLTTYLKKGYVANDDWSESGSRTLDYAFDDHAASIVAYHAGDVEASQLLQARSMNYRHIYNAGTGFMEARNGNGTWAGSDQGWTEGDQYIYTFDVMHDPQGLATLMGGPANMKTKLDEYFSGGHNDQTNEPSHHAPYLYAAIGFPESTQNLTRAIAAANYNATSAGLSGNEDLGQMSAWYVFSALGFYPVNPASDEYVVGAPFFEKVTLRLPAGAATGGEGGSEHTITISAPGAQTHPFVAGLKVDGKSVLQPVLTHTQLVTASLIEFEMAATPQRWGSSSTV